MRRTLASSTFLFITVTLCAYVSVTIANEGHAAQAKPQAHTEESLCNIREAWAPPSLAGSTLGVAYFTIESPQDNTIIAAQSPIAKTAELHTHVKQGNIMQMRKLGSVPVAANTPLVFAPSGLHIMLYNIKRPLLNNTHFPLTITCAKGGKVTTQVEVSQARLLQAIKSRMQ